MSDPSPESPSQRIGGEAAVRRLVHRFDQLMDELPEAYGIRKLHPADLSASEEKLFEFFSGWLAACRAYARTCGRSDLGCRARRADDSGWGTR